MSNGLYKKLEKIVAGTLVEVKLKAEMYKKQMIDYFILQEKPSDTSAAMSDIRGYLKECAADAGDLVLIVCAGCGLGVRQADVRIPKTAIKDCDPV